MTKIAIFSDIHGNLNALQAAYADANSLGAVDYWFLGDLLGPGPDVQSVWKELTAINPSIRIRGNWEDFLIAVLAGKDHLSPAQQAIEKYVINGLDNPQQTCKILSKWPRHQEISINGVRIGLSHHLVSNNNGDALSVRADNAALSTLFTGSRQQLDVAIYAHIHHPLLRYVDLSMPSQIDEAFDYQKADERLVLNPGSIGLPFDKPTRQYKERRAEYLLLDIANNGSVNPVFRRVPYDLNQEFQRAHDRHLPQIDSYISGFHI
ncbi:metallophosphoesterase [Lacticaseibacillus casei]|uniref:Metallophosphoesterase family protein n=1 Tax=Lacticaseibacillus zeae TaxID=57037 RepID=A0A5R8LKL5_LACZE|nr:MULTISPECIES: metallophosphoesterase family protein [Lacticaseibacillus]MDE3283270.1 metallophosphatase family protein [Lacticaseibacillus casei]OLS07688.1 metallophosphoesterase [Lacticaseibacillus casei]QVI31435.1 metallophosphoesterase family protein [Lacticaseibacillus zeae]TLF37725.1 metallophosphoesterase family protein [Lacticaseibacillus zeae]